MLEEVNQPSEVKEIRTLGQGPRAAMGQRFRAKVTTYYYSLSPHPSWGSLT